MKQTHKCISVKNEKKNPLNFMLLCHPKIKTIKLEIYFVGAIEVLSGLYTLENESMYPKYYRSKIKV